MGFRLGPNPVFRLPWGEGEAAAFHPPRVPLGAVAALSTAARLSPGGGGSPAFSARAVKTENDPFRSPKAEVRREESSHPHPVSHREAARLVSHPVPAD